MEKKDPAPELFFFFFWHRFFFGLTRTDVHVPILDGDRGGGSTPRRSRLQKRNAGKIGTGAAVSNVSLLLPLARGVTAP